MNNPLEGIDVTPEEIVNAQGLRTKLSHNGGVCVCGHSHNSHTENVPPGKSATHDKARATRKPVCIPSRHTCPCRKYQEVLTADKTNKFRRVTAGSGAAHALIQGVVDSTAAGIEVRWTPGLSCVKCHRTKAEAPLAPVAYDIFWYEAKHPTDLNVMICKDCRDLIEFERAGIPEHQRADHS